MLSLGTELEMLVWSALLYVVQIMIPAMEADVRNGVAWGLGNRDGDPSEPAAWAARAQRAHRNMAESLLPFVCLIVASQSLGASGEWSALGATVFFFSRLAHAFFYVAGITVVRSLAYFGGLIGMGMIVYQVL